MVRCRMMKNNLPFIGNDTKKVCIICEGNEEYGYFERLTTQSKKANASLIEKYTGIQNYRAHKGQIETLVTFITVENYNEMRLRLEEFPTDDKIVSSTNILKFIKYFETEEDSWIDDINSVVESAV